MERYLQSGDVVRDSISAKEYCIDGLVGTGASCAVYRAHCTDMEEHRTEHLLKEFNPRGVLLYRNDMGALCPFNEKDQGKFASELEHFESGADIQEEVRRASGLVNRTSNIQNRFSANRTRYIDMTVQEGETYDKIPEDSLYSLLRRIKSITSVLKEYHQHGLLHLDVKPENIFILPETDELVQMLDFDSVVRKADIPTRRTLSYTTGWAAQEQVLARLRNDICEATDLFAVGEILFFKLMGRHSYPHERRSFSKIEFDHTAPIFKDVNPKLFPLLSEILRHTICNTISMRYPSADALLEALEKALSLAMPNKPFFASHLPGQASFFIGRDRQLQAIHQTLQGHDVLFVSGIGGIGKSELAKQYAYLHAEAYDAVLFAICTTDLKSMLLDDTQIPIAHFHREEEEKSEAYYSRKMGKLRELCDSRILIITDNLNNLQDPVLSELLKLNCKLLITTRADAGAWSYPQLIIPKLECDSDIRCLFDHWYPHAGDSPETEESITAILDFYNGHTLAVELIAKQMQAGRITPQKMWQTLTSAGLAGAGKERVASRKDDTAKQQSAYDHIRDLFRISALTEEQIYVLVNLSLIPPSGISAELFQQWCNLESFDTINELVSAGWVREDPQTWTISLHPLIADVMQEQLEKNCMLCEHLLDSLPNYFSEDIPYKNRMQIAFITPHICNRLCRLSALSISAINFVCSLSLCTYPYGNTQLYLHYLTQILDHAYAVGDRNSESKINDSLGILYMESDNFIEAEICFQRALSINQALYGICHHSVATCYNNLGVLLDRLGRYSEAIDSYEKAIEIQQLIPSGEFDPDLDELYANLAGSYYELGLWNRAKEQYLKALRISLHNNGERHAVTANIYNALGVIYLDTGDLDNAKKYLTLAVDIRLETYGEDHIDVAGSYSNFALLLEELRDYQLAETYAKKALDIRKRIFGMNHSGTAISYNNLGAMYWRQNNYKEAESNYQIALNINKCVYGHSHPETASVYNNLGVLYGDMERVKDAEIYLQQALQIRCTCLGQSHLDTALSYSNLASFYYKQNELEKAQQHCQSAISILEDGEAKDSSILATCYFNLGVILGDLLQSQQAEYSYNRSLEIRSKIYGEDHIAIADVYYNLGLLFYDVDMYADAEHAFSRYLSIISSIQSDRSADVANAYYNLALTQQELNNLSDAESNMHKALEIRRMLFGETDENTLQAKQDLEDIRSAMA